MKQLRVFRASNSRASNYNNSALNASGSGSNRGLYVISVTNYGLTLSTHLVYFGLTTPKFSFVPHDVSSKKGAKSDTEQHDTTRSPSCRPLPSPHVAV